MFILRCILFSWEMGIQTRRSDIVILLLFIYGEGPVMEMNFLLNQVKPFY